jgi:hypothetical protein
MFVPLRLRDLDHPQPRRRQPDVHVFGRSTAK